MSIAILDPACHAPGLKELFPEADFFSHEPDTFFSYLSTKHLTQKQVQDKYGFSYITDWTPLFKKKYDSLMIVAPLLDYFDPNKTFEKAEVQNMKDRIRDILIVNSFEKVVLFDTFDYDYDPTTIGCTWRVDYFFKRNYNKNKRYSANVIPFPYIMFVDTCVLHTILKTKVQPPENRIAKAAWAGSLYNHIDTLNNVERKRLEIYAKLKDEVDTLSFSSEGKYMQALKKYKVGIDLIGVGDPNKKTFEILSSGALLMTMCSDLNWGFYPNDDFHEDVYFKDSEEFKQKLAKILTDDTLYNACMKKQNMIIHKYFNKAWLSTYIRKHIGIHEKVTLFLTACGRPDLLKETLLSFQAYNTYPIEEAIIMEDSGNLGINDFTKDILKCPVTILYTTKRQGQMKSIENGLQYLKTPYVFHCEEDWKFYNYGFIERSLEILKSPKGDKITSVWLRPYDDLQRRYGFTIVPTEGETYFTIGIKRGYFSWNPGLKTLKVAKEFTPYFKSNLLTVCEGGLDKAFASAGMYSAITEYPEGYVDHIGWHAHVN